jgi:hypothetical protein
MDVCFLPASRRPFLLHNTVYVCIHSEVPQRAMSASALDCEILINAVHLRPALWKQSDKNYQNRDLKMKIWEEVSAVIVLVSKKKLLITV